MLVQKGQLTESTEQIWVVGTITFSAKRSTHAVDTVGTVNMGGGDI